MASNPMQRCCVVGVKHEGKPQGQIKHIDNIRTYATYPPDNPKPENAILIMTDVLGMDFPNIQLIADQFAQNGYLTVIPDVFNGSEVPFPVPESFDLQEYIKTTMPKTDTVDPMFEKVIKHLRDELEVKRLGGIGYCFGGKYVCRFLKEGGLSNGGIDAGFTAHPSFVDEEEVRNIKGPLSIAAAETDSIFPAEKRRETEDILKDHTAPYQMFLYSDVEHGFGVKGDLSHAKARFAKEQAFLQAVGWLNEYVRKIPGV
ncbi:dienelactone hydrolase [Alternaria rosae]|uniref:dienelactone hydrolase n=1 Tax=Alternaria rosae TaxID=1187941 RepID=UPI001E8ECD20|nr:dienelactone hydrolase [Alternaria rosae]KAH6851454.1 dienelactone hydrolase [Alternaria rosae]